MSQSHASLVAELLQTRTVLRELTEAVQTPKSGRRFFLAFKAALDLLETEYHYRRDFTEGAQKP